MAFAVGDEGTAIGGGGVECVGPNRYAFVPYLDFTGMVRPGDDSPVVASVCPSEPMRLPFLIVAPFVYHPAPSAMSCHSLAIRCARCPS